MIKKISFCLLTIFLLCNQVITCEASQFFQEDENIVIVIDPGHGGENYGTAVNSNFLEKDINLITANALIEELSKYTGVTVYTTRTDDVDLSLKERAVFAKEVDADFLISLHYNASENHTIFGAEVWIPLYAPYHAPAYQFAYIQLQEMEEMGLFIRGIKTRTNDNGNDYYGIIREASARDIPAVIIEHCHVDESRDSAFCASNDMFVEFGRRDARAIAKFLNLDSSLGNLSHALTSITVNDIFFNTYNDYEAPYLCKIDLINADYSTGKLSLSVNAIDENTHIQYYDYSLDGGKTYSMRYPWPNCNGLTGEYDKTITLELDIPENTKPRIVVRAYNKFDIPADSNMLSDFDTFRPIHIEDPAVTDFIEMYYNSEAYISTINENTNSDTSNKNETFSTSRILLLLVFVIFWICILIFGTKIIFKCFKKS